MDKISFAGLIIGIVAILGGQFLEGGSIGSLAQPTALLIVGGGTLGAVMLQNTFKVFVRGLKMAAWVWLPPRVNSRRVVDNIVKWAQISRREGLLSLENYANQQDDGFTRKGLEMLVDGADPERLKDALEVEIDAYEEELRQGAKVWDSAGGYSPTIGILGAVLGLIHVMENLSDPSKLGAGIATAFVATIYGVGFANLIFLPIAGKLKYHIARLVKLREMMVDGLVGIANGENPRIIESRLRGYMG